MTHHHRVRLFGVAMIEVEGAAEPILRSSKAVALLAYLAHQYKPVARGHLAALLWGETTDYRSRRNLTHTFGQLTSRFPGCFRADQQCIMWAPDATATVDVRLCAEALRGSARGLPVPHNLGGEADRLAAAVDCYQGELLAGHTLDDSPEFDAWLIRERERWRQQMAVALAALGAHHTNAGDHVAAIGYMRRWIALEPWQEEAHRALMWLLAASGRRAEALIQYQRCHRILADELGITPSAETDALAVDIRSGLLHRNHLPNAWSLATPAM